MVLLQYLKADKTNRKENNSADSQSDSQSSVSDSPSAAPPPFHRSQEFPRRPLEPFHLHSFPKVQKNLIYFYSHTWPSIKKAHIILLWKWKEALDRCTAADIYLILIMVARKMSNAAERDQRKLLIARQQENSFGVFYCNKHTIKIHHTIPQIRTKWNTHCKLYFDRKC